LQSVRHPRTKYQERKRTIKFNRDSDIKILDANLPQTHPSQKLEEGFQLL